MALLAAPFSSKGPGFMGPSLRCYRTSGSCGAFRKWRLKYLLSLVWRDLGDRVITVAILER